MSSESPNTEIRKVTLSFTPFLLFQWYQQSKEIFQYCFSWIFCLPISLFDTQGLRVTIVIVQVGAGKIYVVAAVEALKEKERGYETQFTTKIGGKN